MVRIVDLCLLPNLHIILKDLAVSNKIFGTYLNEIEGKTVSQKTPEVQVEIVSVAMNIMSL